ncbi:MAG: hypothetical protein Q9193_007093 [Seirophora villosa]
MHRTLKRETSTIHPRRPTFRPETETWATHLATLIPTHPSLLLRGSDATPQALRILDLCTGTGCIALLLHSLLHRTHPSLHILGIDPWRVKICTTTSPPITSSTAAQRSKSASSTAISSTTKITKQYGEGRRVRAGTSWSQIRRMSPPGSTTTARRGAYGTGNPGLRLCPPPLIPTRGSLRMRMKRLRTRAMLSTRA